MSFDIAKYAASLNQAAPAGERDIETITGEIIQLKQDAGNAILAIGDRLIEAKSLLSHGEWMPWLEDRVEFSVRTANNFMRLSREWRNSQALANLGATKALTLLALPPEERESFMAENHLVDGEEKSVIDMTSRELEKAVRERDEARKAAEAAQAEARSAEDIRAKMEQDMAALKALSSSAKEAAEQAAADLLAAREELRVLREKPVEVAVETVVDQEAVKKARAEAIAEMQAKVTKAENAKKAADEKRKAAEAALKTAKADAASQAEERVKNLADELAIARRQLEAAARADKQSQLAGDRDLATFNVLFDQAQEQVNKLRGLLLKVRKRDQEAAGKLQTAILALADLVRGCAE